LTRRESVRWKGTKPRKRHRSTNHGEKKKRHEHSVKKVNCISPRERNDRSLGGKRGSQRGAASDSHPYSEKTTFLVDKKEERERKKHLAEKDPLEKGGGSAGV